jgi:hypothetical protein
MPMVNRIHGQCDHQWGLGRVLRLGTELLGAVLLLSVLLPRQGMKERFVLRQQPAIRFRKALGLKQGLACRSGHPCEQPVMMVERFGEPPTQVLGRIGAGQDVVDEVSLVLQYAAI